MLKSLMLIHLLNIAKVQGRFLPILFIASLSFNSKHQTLKELSTLLLQFFGNVYRLLARLGYHTCYIQVALEEYYCQVKNMAINLRDGLQLTRLVKSLLSFDNLQCHHKAPCSGGEVQHQTSNNAVGQEVAARALSYQQKYLYLHRSSKIHNVQIALNTIRGPSEAGLVVGSMKANDMFLSSRRWR